MHVRGRRNITIRCHDLLLCAVLVAGVAGAARAANEPAARYLAHQNACFRCHGVEKHKDGPTWKDVADKYRNDPGAEAHLTEHLATGLTVHLESGYERHHPIVKARDREQIRNLVEWILSIR